MTITKCNVCGSEFNPETSKDKPILALVIEDIFGECQRNVHCFVTYSAINAPDFHVCMFCLQKAIKKFGKA